jgi:chorismate mutase
MPHDELSQLRDEMDALNLDLRALLQRRALLVGEIVRLKRARGLPPVDAEREAEMMRRVLDRPGPGFEPDALRAIFAALFVASRALAARISAPHARQGSGSAAPPQPPPSAR